MDQHPVVRAATSSSRPTFTLRSTPDDVDLRELVLVVDDLDDLSRDREAHTAASSAAADRSGSVKRARRAQERNSAAHDRLPIRRREPRSNRAVADTASASASPASSRASASGRSSTGSRAAHGLGGFVLNDGDGVVIEAEGEPAALDAFAARAARRGAARSRASTRSRREPVAAARRDRVRDRAERGDGAHAR